MTKKSEQSKHKPEASIPDNPDEMLINELIEKRRLQQEALIKIMTSIDKVTTDHDGFKITADENTKTKKVLVNKLRGVKKKS